MSWAGIAVGVGGAIIGGITAADASNDAADAQVQSAHEANQLQRQMFEEGRADQAPWRDRGNAAGNLLQYYLGIDPLGAGNGPRSNGPANNYGLGPAPTMEQFTTWHGGGGVSPGYTGNTDSGRGSNIPPSAYIGGFGGPTVDHAGFQAAMNDYQTKLQAAKLQADQAEAAARAEAAGDPRFGSLLKPFTGASVATDPGYQFGLHQGEQAVTNQRAALGSLLSGATLKDLTQFGNDYAGTKFNEAFQRDQATKTLTNNMLAGVSGTGQTSATNIANQGNTTGALMGQNIIGAGNARASGYVGQANAFNGALGTAINQYNSANLLKSLNSGGNQGGTGPYDPGVSRTYYDDVNI